MPSELLQAMQALGNLALVIICIAMIFGMKKLIDFSQQLITITARLDSHIQMDDMRFSRLNQDVGRHDSQINDIKSQNIGNFADSLRALLSQRSVNDH